ncbi:MAG: hypothetical protein AAF456_09880 [Planctomycetota bacterium]
MADSSSAHRLPRNNCLIELKTVETIEMVKQTNRDAGNDFQTYFCSQQTPYDCAVDY